MELLELYKLFLMLSLGTVMNVGSVSPKCKNYDDHIYCDNLVASDYPVSFVESNDTFHLVLTNTGNLPDFAFSGIQIESLVIRGSDIRSIGKDAFTGNEDTLKVVEISTEAKQVQAPVESLENLYNLEELQIFGFVLTRTLNDMNFANLSRLESLHLEDNNLDFFEKPVFKGLSALTKLTIKKNMFMRIPLPSIFGDLRNLTILDMSDNKIGIITQHNLVESKSLRQLILQQNALAQIEKDAFKGLENSLEVLDLRINKLKPAQLINIEAFSLKELVLQANRIHALPIGIFKNLNLLQVLNLKSNVISDLKNGSLQGLIHLKTLLLDSNNLAVEAGTLLDTPQLQEIYFKEQNKVLQMEWLQDATSLLKLYLNGNRFNETSLWLAIRSLPKLEYLSLSKCNLGYIPDFAFEQNRQLQTLKLDENGLQELRQETFQGLQESLTSINLELNQLQTIDECVFQNFNWSLQQEMFPISLYKNELVCNCSLLWLQESINIYLATFTFPISNVNLWNCAGSNELIYKANLTCDSNSTNQTCQDFTDRYTTTTTMAPTTTTYPTTFDETTIEETTATSSTVSITITKETTFVKLTTPPTTTTTMPPPTTTTLPPTTTETPEKPRLSLILEKLSSSSISISWSITSWEHVQKLTLYIDKVIENGPVTKNKIVLSKKDSTIKVLKNLSKGTILTVCLHLKLDFTSKLLDSCDIIRLLETQKKTGENIGIKVGIGVGVAILVTLILILLGVMCYSRTKSEGSSKEHKTEANLNEPKMTPKSKRYKKRTNPNNQPQISVISSEPFQPLPRISAGSYQYLADPNLTSNSTDPSQDSPIGGYDNRAFTESIHGYNVIEETETNNNQDNQNKSPTERPLPNLPGSQNFMQYFQPEEPTYASGQTHYAEIPHTETTI